MFLVVLRVLSPMKLEGGEVVPNAHHSSSNISISISKVEEEAGHLSMEDMVAVVVGELHVVEWALNSPMVDLLNTTNRAGELSSINEVEDNPSAVVAWGAVGHLLVALLGHQYPSCTKQPRLHISLYHMEDHQKHTQRLVLRLSHLNQRHSK